MLKEETGQKNGDQIKQEWVSNPITDEEYICIYITVIRRPIKY